MSNLQRKVTACYGIECYLRKYGIDTSRKNVVKLQIEFLKSISIPYTKLNPRYKGLFTADICNAEKIQEHFKEFQSFIQQKITDV